MILPRGIDMAFVSLKLRDHEARLNASPAPCADSRGGGHDFAEPIASLYKDHLAQRCTAPSSVSRAPACGVIQASEKHIADVCLALFVRL